MIIPVASLSASVLERLLADFATRDGTFVGDGPEPSLDEKIAALRMRLQRGEIKITFDEENETLSLLASD